MVLQSQFDKQGFRFLVSQMVIYIFHPVLSVVQRRRFRQPSHDNRDGGLLQRFSFRTTFTSCLKTGKGILLAANPSDLNAKLDLLVGPCSRVLNPVNTLLNSWFPNFFRNNFRLWGNRCGAVKAFAFL